MENGLKIMADANSMNTKTIYYYWPTNTSMDPLQQGDRRLFTVKYANSLNGQVPAGITSGMTSDKRLGCVPTTTVP